MDNYSDLNDRVDEMRKAKIAAYNKAAKKFIDKVESGRAYSKETYKELKEALAMPEDIT